MRKIALLSTLILISVTTAFAQAPALQGNWKELLAGPKIPADFSEWHTRMLYWRKKAMDSIDYNGDKYHLAGLKWAQSSYIQTQMMVEDRYFYDPAAGKYTVDRYLNDLKKRYGGLDAVLIWPTYPNIGIDNRDQFDMVADMPGGIKGVRQMVADFHSRGVKVFFPIMPWDNGTRDPGPIAPELTKEMAAVGADGLNGDTMYGIPEDFFWADNGNGKYPLALEPEINLKTLDMLQWNTMSWAYYDDYIYNPGVSLYKWLEPLHQPIVNDRWADNKTDDLQYAWFNGMGYCAWENIWGIWNGVAPRYAEIIRRMHLIYSRYPNIFHSEGWEPHTPVLQAGVFASKFPGNGQTLWTFVNRDKKARSGQQIQLAYQPGITYYDLWNGTKLNPIRNGNTITLSFAMEGYGYGAILAMNDNSIVKSDLSAFLSKINKMAEVPLNSLPNKWQFLPQHLVNIAPTVPHKTTPVGMVLIPAAKNFFFDVKGVMIEGDDIPKGVDVQYPWEKTAGRLHHRLMDIKSFYVDQYPVTNLQFKKFMDATHYQPKDAHNFLKYWSNGAYPKGWDNKPVTYVSIEDARAYAKWAGKRLPHEWEWQYAAQGMDGRLYPSGNQSDSTVIPPPDKNRAMREPYDVTAYKEQSPFGVRDLIGNVWQWTDEYTDDHTRAAILRGGSYYYAQTSMWYFPQAHKLNEHGKYLLMSPGRDRAATLGFRCVADR